VYWLHESASCIRKTLTEFQYKVKTTHLHTSILMWESSYTTKQSNGWKILDAVLQSQIQLASNVMAPARGKMMCTTTSGSWENYSVTGDHICIITLFYKWFYNNSIFSSKFLLAAWELWVLRYWITGSLLQTVATSCENGREPYTEENFNYLLFQTQYIVLLMQIRSKSLWRWYFSTNIMFLYIFRCPVFI
jgi:hypothetical protein